MRRARIDLIEEEIDLGNGVCARIARPREPGRLLELAIADGAADAPYWAELWPSARALAARLASLDLHGVRAVELGCGLGLPSVAAALRGATVLAVDCDRAAVEHAVRNGRQAKGRVEGLVADLREPPTAILAAGPFDLVLAADVLYDPTLAASLARLIPPLTAPDGRVLLTYSWRDGPEALADSLAGTGMQVQLGALAAHALGEARPVGLLEAWHGGRVECHQRIG